jgi:hypothetical protein
MLNEYKLWLSTINAPKVIEDKYEVYLKAKKVFRYLRLINY